MEEEGANAAGGQSHEPQLVERFLKFLPLHGHTAVHMEDTLISALVELGIDLMDCRGQSYDNASNMAGKYAGLQARIKEKPSWQILFLALHIRLI